MSLTSEEDRKMVLSTLWIVVMLNMIFADLFSIMVELVNKNTLDIPGEVTSIMAVAAVVTNVPILMIYFSRVLKYSLNRWLNIGAALFTILYVVGGGSILPHYIIIAFIEVVVLLSIALVAWKWKPVQEVEQNFEYK